MATWPIPLVLLIINTGKVDAFRQESSFLMQEKFRLHCELYKSHCELYNSHCNLYNSQCNLKLLNAKQLLF